MKSADRLDSILVRPVVVPIKRPLRTGGGDVTKAPLVLVDLTTSSGVTGRCYLFAIAPFNLKPLAELVRNLFEVVKGSDLVPLRVYETLRRRLALPGTHGLAGMALSGIDMAAWDALARSAGVPLARLLGATPRPLRTYNSNGLGLMSPEEAAAEAIELLEGGFTAMKVRVGRPEAKDDVTAVRAVRKALPETVEVMADFNQALGLSEALHRGRLLDAENCLLWIEEPIRADNFAGSAQLAAELVTPIQIGENFASPQQMLEALRQKACDYVMPDVQRIGGVTGWLHAAALAAAAEIPFSSHLFPEYSAHLLCATPTCHWLEYMDWANPVLAEPFPIGSGEIHIPDRPGSGIEWDEDAVRRYAA
jgi:mandelate racemase